jgi:hypothetical protein
MQLLPIDRLWYAIPLLVASSLVYGATRHESTRAILSHSWRFGAWMVVFMAILYGIVWGITALL